MRSNLLTQKVNFVVSVLFMGSTALLAIIAILRASDHENPIATALEHTVLVQSMSNE